MSIGSGMSVGVRNRLDARERKRLKECRVGNASTRRKGVRVFRSALLRREGVRRFGDMLDASWLRMEPEGSGLALGAWK